MIRSMTETDLEVVLSIEESCFSDAWTKQNFLDSLNEKTAHLLVIESESGDIAGYACLYQVLDEGEIVNVAIDPNCRQKGFGAALVNGLMNLGRELGAERFFLEVRKGNVAGRALYTSLGFVECGIRKGFYENPKEDAVLMMWEMSEVSQ